jgi:hypothetical protein
MTSHETLADLDSIFEAGIKAAAQEEPSKKKLTKVLDRLDDAIANDEHVFTPENTAPMEAYYKFVHAWHDNQERFPKKVVQHYQDTLRVLTFSLFLRHWHGLLAEAMEDAPDVDFLDHCLDEIVCDTCPNGCEEETPFVCVPSRGRVFALLHLQERIEGLLGNDDVEALIEHVKVTRLLHHMDLAVVCDDHFEYANPGDELKSLVLH